MQAQVIPLFDEEQPDIDYLSRLASEDMDLLTDEELALYQAQLPMMQPGHYDNLAEFVEDRYLRKLATEVINWADWDEESREDWEIRESKGIKLLGVSDRTEGGATFEGASKVVHPLLAEATTQFHSRAITELWPPEGPVKTVIMGEHTPDKLQQAERVEDYLNYLYTRDMPGAFEEEDKLLFRLPLSGSCFKKVYYDPLEDKVCSRLVEPADFLVPYSATDLATSPRHTHRIRENHNDVLKKAQVGFYRDVSLDHPTNEDYDYPQQLDEIDHTEGKERVQMDDDQRHTILEMYVDYDLPGFKDTNEFGEETGIALPYIVTVDRDSQEVLRIQRNWKPDSEKRKKRIYFTHYKFCPGLGFYGYGLLHLIGGLSNSATGALRALLDSAAFNNMQGGYRSRDAKIEGGDRPIGPGEWRETNASPEELRTAFFPLPYKEPSKTLFELLGYLDERGQRFAGTTENMVGEANNSAPVGTTLALIEQGSKTFTAIHKRLHEAHAKEFKIVAELCYEYLPDDGYPYEVPGKNNFILQSDFDGRIDVIPVSDPTIISGTQRIAQAQAILDLSEKFPDVISRQKAVDNMLDAMRIANKDELMQAEPSAEQDLEAQRVQAQIQEIMAKIEKLKAETTVKKIEGQYSALQGGQTVATIPEVAPIADELLASAGYEDANGPPLVSQYDRARMPTRYSEQVRINQEMPTNTDPRYPANPGLGMMRGIETPENEFARS